MGAYAATWNPVVDAGRAIAATASAVLSPWTASSSACVATACGRAHVDLAPDEQGRHRDGRKHEVQVRRSMIESAVRMLWRRTSAVMASSKGTADAGGSPAKSPGRAGSKCSGGASGIR